MGQKGILDSDILIDIANAVRNKRGIPETEKFAPSELAERINEIRTTEIKLKPQVEAEPSNQDQIIQVEEGEAFDGLESVLVKACSGTAEVTDTTLTPCAGKEYAQIKDDNLIANNIANGVSVLGIEGNYKGKLETKTVRYTTNGTRYISPSIGKDGISQVTVTVAVPIDVDPSLQDKTATPSSSTQYITADSGYDGLDTVIVYGDSNLSSENIRSGVSIFGYEGSFTDDATATSAAILDGYTAYVNGEKITGSLESIDENNLSAEVVVNPSGNKFVALDSGGKSGVMHADSIYYAANVSVEIDNLISSNIKNGVQIAGVTGSDAASVSTVPVTIKCTNFTEFRVVYCDYADSDGIGPAYEAWTSNGTWTGEIVNGSIFVVSLTSSNTINNFTGYGYETWTWGHPTNATNQEVVLHSTGGEIYVEFTLN